MGSQSVRDLIDVYSMTPTQRLAVARAALRVARSLDLPAIAEALEWLIDGDIEVAELENQWNTQIGILPAIDVVALDRTVDRLFGGVHGTAGNKSEAFGLDTPIGAAAERVVRLGFPSGVAAVTKSPFAEEAILVGRFVAMALPADDARQEAILVADDVRGTLHADIATLGMLPEIDVLADKHVEYAAAVHLPTKAKDDPPKIAWATFKAANDAGQERLRTVVGAIVGLGVGGEPDALAARERLLEPVRAEQEAIAERFRQKIAKGKAKAAKAPAEAPTA